MTLERLNRGTATPESYIPFHDPATRQDRRSTFGQVSDVVWGLLASKVADAVAELLANFYGQVAVEPSGGDDTDNLLAALTVSRKVVLRSGATYKHVPFDFPGDVEIASSGLEPVTLYCETSPSIAQAKFGGTQIGATTVVADVFLMDSWVQVANASQIAVGNLVRLHNNRLWQSDNRGVSYEGQLARVIEKTGNSIKLADTLAVGMPAGSTVTIYSPATVRLRGVRFQRPRQDNVDSRGVTVTRTAFADIKDCEFLDSTRIGLNVELSYMPKVLDCVARGARLIVANQLGYGVLLTESWRPHVERLRAGECRRGLDVGGGSLTPVWYARIANSVFSGGGRADDGSEMFPAGATLGGGGTGSHGTADGTVYEGNTFINCYRGLILRGRNETARGNTFVGAALTAPIFVAYAAGLVIEGNRYLDQFEEVLTSGDFIGPVSRAKRPDALIELDSNTYDQDSQLTLKGNIVRNVRSGLILVTGAANYLRNWIVADNDVVCDPDTDTTVGVLVTESTKYPDRFIARNNVCVAPSGSTVRKYWLQWNPPSTEPVVSQISGSTWRVFIPAEKAARIRMGINEGQLLVRAINATPANTPRLNSMLRINSATSIDLGGSSGVVIAATALTGTTGAPGDVTAAFAGDSLYIENRSGGNLLLVVAVDGVA